MKVAAINDLSGFGKCSLTADMTVLAALGIQCCPLPTAVLSAQTGYPSYYFKDLTGIIPEYLREWKQQEETFDGIITGFMMSGHQAKNSLEFIKAFKSASTKVLVDPVMGDDGKTYTNFSKELLTTIKAMVSEADIITPNLTELCLLTGENPEKIMELKGDDLINEIRRMSIILGGDHDRIIAVTGILLLKKDVIGNFIIENGDSKVITTQSNGIHYSGTGDLFAAILLGEILRGGSAFDATDTASHFIYTAIKNTEKDTDPRAGISYEKSLKLLIN